MTYSSNENKAITFLVAFSEFNDINNVYKMKKLFDKSGVTPEQLRAFNSINNILPNFKHKKSKEIKQNFFIKILFSKKTKKYLSVIFSVMILFDTMQIFLDADFI